MGWLKKLFGGQKAASPRREFAVLTHEAFGGAIRVIEAPTADTWVWDEAERSGDGFTVMLLKYLHPAEPFPLALMVKIYTLAYAPEPPADTDWPAAFDGLFSELQSVDVKQTQQTTMTSLLDATEALLTGTDQQGAALVVRERRAIFKNEQFIVTAMGPAEAMQTHQSTVDKWFETAAVVPYSPESSGS